MEQSNLSQGRLSAFIDRVADLTLRTLCFLSIFLPAIHVAIKFHSDQTLKWSHLNGAMFIFLILFYPALMISLFHRQKYIKFLRVVWVAATLYPFALSAFSIGGMMSWFAATLYMLILGFPFSVLGMIVVELVSGILRLEAYRAEQIILWCTLFVTGYYQWFVIGPKVAKERRKKVINNREIS